MSRPAYPERQPVFTGHPKPQNAFTKAGLAATIEQIKRDARRLSRAGKLTHCQALEQLAQQNGFKTYAALVVAHKVVS